MNIFNLISDNLINSSYYKSLDRRLQIKKRELLINWVNEDLLDEDLIKTYFSIKIDDELFSNLLEYSLHKGELIDYELVKNNSSLKGYDINTHKFFQE
ncbi:hypothetical protein GF352_04130 [archaeon]|nr:hypothetical protein [archaeon]